MATIYRNNDYSYSVRSIYPRVFPPIILIGIMTTQYSEVDFARHLKITHRVQLQLSSSFERGKSDVLLRDLDPSSTRSVLHLVQKNTFTVSVLFLSNYMNSDAVLHLLPQSERGDGYRICVKFVKKNRKKVAILFFLLIKK